MLIAFRFLQGLGACAGMVVPRAIVRDLHTGIEAARLMSLLMLVFSVSPILAPLTGSVVIECSGWRGVFWVVTVAALVGHRAVATSLKETRPAEHRVDSSLRQRARGLSLAAAATATSSASSSSAASASRASSSIWRTRPSC